MNLANDNRASNPSPQDMTASPWSLINDNGKPPLRPPGSREIVDSPVVPEHNLNNWTVDLGSAALHRLGYEPSSSSSLVNANSFPSAAARRACKSSALHVFDNRAILGTVVQATAPATSIGFAVQSSEWTNQRPRDGFSERLISAPSLAVFSQQSDNSNEIAPNLVDTNAPT